MRIIVWLRLLISLGTMAYAAFLPAYSDRIVQDSHLIPFYPRIVAQTALNLRGTENLDLQLFLHYISTLHQRQLLSKAFQTFVIFGVSPEIDVHFLIKIISLHE